MHLGTKKLAENFELEDLQLIDGPPMRGAQTVVCAARSVLGVAGTAFVAFDETASEAVIRESSGHLSFHSGYPISGSVASEVRTTLTTVRISDLTERKPSAPEWTASGAMAFMASPVLAPDGRAAGMLTALDLSPRLWTIREVKQIEDLAYLISQEVILRASFATLGIMARERSLFRL